MRSDATAAESCLIDVDRSWLSDGCEPRRAGDADGIRAGLRPNSRRCHDRRVRALCRPWGAIRRRDTAADALCPRRPARSGRPHPGIRLKLGKPSPDADGARFACPSPRGCRRRSSAATSIKPGYGRLGAGGLTLSKLSNPFASSSPCAPALSAVSASLASAASTGSITVDAGATCEWTATSNAMWLTIKSAMPATGTGAAGFAATANTTTAERSGTLTIAGKTVTITQAGGRPACSYAIDPTSRTVQAAGETTSVAVTAASGCAWTATTSASWITFPAGASGNGNGSVSLGVAVNSATAQRTGTVAIPVAHSQ